MQFKEESLLNTARQLITMDARVLLFLDVSGASRRHVSKLCEGLSQGMY
jgi:hypothetical protein